MASQEGVADRGGARPPAPDGHATETRERQYTKVIGDPVGYCGLSLTGAREEKLDGKETQIYSYSDQSPHQEYPRCNGAAEA
jgi:hypothetical protein